MEKALDVFRNDLKGLRTGRASPQMLDSLRVDNYGTMSPIQRLASVTCPDAATIVIKPYAADSLKEIEKAIRSSDLGLAPNNDGKVIRLIDPGDERRPAEEDRRSRSRSRPRPRRCRAGTSAATGTSTSTTPRRPRR